MSDSTQPEAPAAEDPPAHVTLGRPMPHTRGQVRVSRQSVKVQDQPADPPPPAAP